MIDLRSDTVTKPTPEMRRAMAEAEVGDDVYGEDPTVNRLEELAAAMTGKEAGLFVTSGTQGNQVALMTHTRRGDEVILESEAHIFYYEAGAMAVLSGVQPRLVKGRMGILDPADIEAAIRPADLHFPRTSLICVENTHNRGGGTVTPPEVMKGIWEVARKHGLSVHVDGARIFNAAAALGVDVKELTKYADSVQICLSKGLSAPVGSVLVGPKDWIERARKYRKILGGGMRQAGVIAAAGIIALEKMVDRLAEDHANARLLAEGLAAVPGIFVDLATVQTNIVYVKVDGTGMEPDEFVARLKERGVLCGASVPNRVRFVTHKDVSRSDIEETIEIVRDVVVGRR